MKLIALHNTAFEKSVQDLFNELITNQDCAKDIVEKYIGIRPDCFLTVWDYGDSGCLSTSCIHFRKEDEEKLDPSIIKRNSNEHPEYFEPNTRSLTGQNIKKELIEKVAGRWLRGCVLEDFGIHTIVNGILYFPWLPSKDSTGNYIIEIADAAEKYIDKDVPLQFSIMYDNTLVNEKID